MRVAGDIAWWQVAATWLVSVALGALVVKGLLWAAAREAVADARRAAEGIDVVVRTCPRRVAQADCLDD